MRKMSRAVARVGAAGEDETRNAAINGAAFVCGSVAADKVNSRSTVSRRAVALVQRAQHRVSRISLCFRG